MATHSSILAWEIPWTEEPCGKRVRLDLPSKQQQHAHLIHLASEITVQKLRCDSGDIQQRPFSFNPSYKISRLTCGTWLIAHSKVICQLSAPATCLHAHSKVKGKKYVLFFFFMFRLDFKNKIGELLFNVSKLIFQIQLQHCQWGGDKQDGIFICIALPLL